MGMDLDHLQFVTSIVSSSCVVSCILFRLSYAFHVIRTLMAGSSKTRPPIYGVFERFCINNQCMLKAARETGQLGNEPTVSRIVMGRGSLSHCRE